MSSDPEANPKGNHTNADGVPGPSTKGPRWLNSVEVVEEILRKFASEAIRRLGDPDGAEWVKQRAIELNATFLGNGYADREIFKTGPWNTPEFIGHNCLQALQISGEDRHGPMLALLDLAVRVNGIVHAHEGEEIETYGSLLDYQIERTRNALCGLPLASTDINDN